MGRLEDKFVYQTQWANWLVMWVRFIDDIFLIWKGDRDSLIHFLDYLNNVVPSIKFTHEISTDSVNFLETTVLKDGKATLTLTFIRNLLILIHTYIGFWHTHLI